MKQFPLLIFDWDGTLVNSITRIVTSLQYASSKVAGCVISESNARDVIGMGLAEAINTLHPELDAKQDAITLTRIADTYRQHYLYENTVPAPLFDGVTDLLAELKDAGYILAVSTGKSRLGLDKAIAEHNMGEFFTTTRCAGENKSKPDPEMLHEILDELNFAAAEALMIGDSELDLRMANNARMKCIGVTHGVHDADTLNQYGPLACLPNISDLSDFLNHNYPEI